MRSAHLSIYPFYRNCRSTRSSITLACLSTAVGRSPGVSLSAFFVKLSMSIADFLSFTMTTTTKADPGLPHQPSILAAAVTATGTAADVKTECDGNNNMTVKEDPPSTNHAFEQPTSRRADHCPLCYTDFSEETDDDIVNEQDLERSYSFSSKNQRVQLDACAHVVCRPCLQEYCQYCLSIHKVPIPCPAYAGCGRKDHDNENKDDDDHHHLDTAPCPHDVLPNTVRQVLMAGSNQSENQWRKYWRLWRLSNDPTLVACPHCQEPVPATSGAGDESRTKDPRHLTEDPPDVENQLVLLPVPKDKPGGDDDDDGENNHNTNSNLTKQNRRVCHSCDSVFCAVHGVGHHPDRQTCQDYDAQSQAQQEATAIAAAVNAAATGTFTAKSKLAKHKNNNRTPGSANHRTRTNPSTTPPPPNALLAARPNVPLHQMRACSHCGAMLWKAGGCDHLVCPACHQDMCFKCGTHLHLSGKVLRHCSKCRQGFVDHRYQDEYQRQLWCWLPFMVPGWILYTLGALVVAVVTCGYCCFFGCGMLPDCTKEEEWDEEEWQPPTLPLPPSDANNPRNNKPKLVLGTFAPCLGVRKALAWTFLPFVLCFRDLGCTGWGCGSCLEGLLPEAMLGGPQPENNGRNGPSHHHHDANGDRVVDDNAVHGRARGGGRGTTSPTTTNSTATASPSNSDHASGNNNQSAPSKHRQQLQQLGHTAITTDTSSKLAIEKPVYGSFRREADQVDLPPVALKFSDDCLEDAIPAIATP